MIALYFTNGRAATLALAFALAFLSFPLRQVHASEETEPPRVRLGPWVGDLKVGPKMNAVGRHLKGSEFIGQDLRGAVFDGCDLEGAVFYQCDLSNASFRDAWLTGMNITDCRVGRASFAGAIINGVVGMSGGLTDPRHNGWPHDMNLSPEQFMSTRSYKTKDLRKCVISFETGQEAGPPKYDFRGAHLEGAYLRQGDCSQCDFTDARIDGIDVVRCRIDFKQLASTHNFRNRRSLKGARFSTVPFTGKWDLSGMDLSGTREFPAFSFNNDHINFADAVITQCMFGGTITKTQLRSTRSFKEGDLRQITFYHIDFSEFDFSGVNLSGCKFLGCNFTGARFEDAVINDAQFTEHQPYPEKRIVPDFSGLTAPQIQSTWNYKHRRMAGIVLPKDIAAALLRE